MSAALAAPVGRIGPNAVTRVAEVLRERFGSQPAARVLERAGLAAYVDVLPSAMIAEEEVIRLHCALREMLGGSAAREVARQAGERTGDYVVAQRIPRAVRVLLQCLPAPLAARVLLRAIARHSWTFSGTGRFRIASYAPVRVAIEGNPLCRGLRADTPQCHYYAATFERLFRVLVHGEARVTEVDCEASGAGACVFEIRWGARLAVRA
jgi:divinyl protochlorophyllide a 8-vinyl-reductase